MLYRAILRHGRTYHCFGVQFEQDKPGPRLVTEAEKNYLEGEAVLVEKTKGGRRIPSSMFEFEAVAEEAPAPAAQTANEDDGDQDQSGETGQDTEGAAGNGSTGADDEGATQTAATPAARRRKAAGE